tara:strand:+ start:1421 stop:1915 length:495 start_codon:yes stop_codon:yes gene_type:complete
MDLNCNGRINIMGDNTMKRFEMYDKISLDNKDDFRNQALTGNWEKNILSDAFFSQENISILQNGIRAGVYNLSNKRYLISNQNNDTLKMIMRAIFLQHSKNLPNNITQQIQELNKMVIDYSVPQVFGEANSYIKYKNDASTMHMPHKRPMSTYRDKTLELKPWF